MTDRVDSRNVASAAARTFAVAAALAFAASASAKDDAAIEAAKELAKKGEWVKAAERFGDVVAAAQKAGDLQAEQDAADAAESFFDDVPANPSSDAKTPDGKPKASGPSRAAVLAGLMRRLDVARCGACVSAPTLARNVLELATESGDFAPVADAAKVVAAKSASGAAAAVVAKYAEGLKAAAEGRLDDASAALQSAASDAGKAKWFDLAAHVATELAATRLRQNAPDQAVAAIAAAASTIDGSCGVGLTDSWRSMAELRCKSAPPALFNPIDDLAARAKESKNGGSSAGAAGGGSGRTSPIGKLLQNWPKGKPLVAAARKTSGFEISWATKQGAKPVVAFPGGKSQAVEGGVTLGFYGRSVALVRVDLEDDAGVAIGGGEPSPVRAFYLVADGETWSVSREGLVTVGR
jgi:hypothetical protein